MRFFGFTYKKSADDSQIKNIVTLFDEIEQARDQKKKSEKKRAELKATMAELLPKGEGGQLQSHLLGQTQGSPRQLISPRMKLSSSPQPEPTKKQEEIRPIPAPVIYMGPYSKGSMARSPSKEASRALPFGETASSPRKPGALITSSAALATPLSSRKAPNTPDARTKPEFLRQNPPMSPSTETNKKKMFGFLGLKFLSKGPSVKQ